MRPLMLALGILLVGCGGAEPPADALPFLEGTWAAQAEGFRTVEAWRVVSGGGLLGSGSATAADGGLLFVETMAVVSADGRLALVTWPRGQEPVTYEAVEHDDTSVSFRNDAHDFPKVITYRRTAQDTLEARATGVEADGRPREERWTLTRVPDAPPAGTTPPAP